MTAPGVEPAVALATLRHRDGLYQAGIPGYTSNFSRDGFTYGLLANDLDALRAQLRFSARHQGQRADPETGEEPGKIHHELPGVRQDGLWTTYDACDSTALFLLAIAHVAAHGGDDLQRRYRSCIERALEYLRSHLIDDVFHEDTRQSDADHFALKVTYWKDSELNLPGPEKAARYPIAYALVHFQYVAALRAMADLMESTELANQADSLTERGLEAFWRGDHFAVAVRGDAVVADATSSDSLHTLLFLEPGTIDSGRLALVEPYSEPLATPFGYLPALPVAADVDPYHTRYVWVHEQALLYAAANRHGLRRAMEIAARVMPAFEHGFPELIDPENGSPIAGNRTQLWSVGAYLYFERSGSRADASGGADQRASRS